MVNIVFTFFVSDVLSFQATPAFAIRPLQFSEYFRFNRVEGLYFGAGINLHKQNATSSAGVNLSAGYGTSSQKKRYSVKTYIGHQTGQIITILSANIYDLTETIGFRNIGFGGNSITSLFFKEDYLDFYRKNGISIGIEERYRDMQLIVEGRHEKNNSLSVATQKSLSITNDSFRKNPEVDEGNLRSISMNLIIDHVETPGAYPRGYKQMLELITAGGKQLGGSFRFNRIQAHSSFFFRGLWSQLITIHAKLGASKQYLPKQYAFHLGGPGSLRGEPVNYHRGNHFWLVTFDHYLPPKPFDRFKLPNPFFYSLRPIIFADIGSVWTSSSTWKFPRERLLSDVGIGIGDTGHLFRLNYALSLAQKNSKSRWTLLFTYHW